jgi:hypothetical protein
VLGSVVTYADLLLRGDELQLNINLRVSITSMCGIGTLPLSQVPTTLSEKFSLKSGLETISQCC